MRDHRSNVPGVGEKPLPPLVSPPLSSPSSPKLEILEFPRASPRLPFPLLTSPLQGAPVQSRHSRHHLIPPPVMATFFTSNPDSSSSHVSECPSSFGGWPLHSAPVYRARRHSSSQSRRTSLPLWRAGILVRATDKKPISTSSSRGSAIIS